MFYINTVSGEYPITEEFIRAEHPNTSFTKPFVPLAPYASVAETLKPEYDHMTHKLVEVAPVQTDNGYVRQWLIENLFADVIEKNQKEALELRAAQVRDDRNSLLSQSDWTQVADAPVDKQAWADYRQALREIPDQAGFPWNVVWPEQPA